MLKKIIFVDFENVNQFNLDGFESQGIEVIFFVGTDYNVSTNQKLKKALDLKFVKKKKTPKAKNNLDEYLLEVAITKSHQLETNIEFVICTKDKQLTKQFNQISNRKTKQISILTISNFKK